MDRLSEMIKFDFSAEKNQHLIKNRQISFEEIIGALDNNRLLDVIKHPNLLKYPHQEVLVLDIGGYVYLVPFVWKTKQEVFLKTIFPSRKLTKKYFQSEQE